MTVKLTTESGSSQAEVAQDAKVFEALSEAQQQYAQYLALNETALLVQVWSDALVVPPPPDPLSLTVWPDSGSER
jgi:hypothetical protein